VDTGKSSRWHEVARGSSFRAIQRRKEDKHVLSMDVAFLKFLEQMDEEAKRENELDASRPMIELKAENVIDAEAVEVDDGECKQAEG